MNYTYYLKKNNFLNWIDISSNQELAEQESVADVVIDVCGSWDVIPYALHALCHRGIYLFVGESNSECSSIDIQIILKKCITIRGEWYFKENYILM